MSFRNAATGILPLLPLIAVSLLAQITSSGNDDVVRAATNPYDLARFIDSHLGFDWNVLWKALGTQGYLIQPCGKLSDGKRQCSVELITVLDPDQEILLVQGDLTPADVYIRFLKQKNGAWKFSGVQGAQIHNHPRRHEVDRSSGTPFLRISSQGVRGSGIDSEIENWYDLTQPGFEPVFSFTSQGYKRWPEFGIGRKVSAYLSAQKNSIDVMLAVEFNAMDDDGEIPLGSANYSAVYTRPDPAKPFRIEAASTDFRQKSKVPPSEFEALADINSEISNEDLVKLDMAALTELASGKDIAARNRLKRLLNHFDNTTEVLKLKALLR
jgi:hypothetical protein